jgi:hypothetical protein
VRSPIPRHLQILEDILAIHGTKDRGEGKVRALYASSNSQGGQSHLHDCASRRLTEESPVGVTASN